MWLGAERVRHLVVLRAHLLPVLTLAALERLGADAGVEVWAVAHDGAPRPGAVHWTVAVAELTEVNAASTREPSPTELYGTVRDLARRAGRTWRLYTERTVPRGRRP